MDFCPKEMTVGRVGISAVRTKVTHNRNLGLMLLIVN